VLAPFLTRYLKSREQVDIHLLEEGGVRALARVESGEAHFAVAIRQGNDHLEGRTLFPFRVQAAVPLRHRLARRTTIDVTDLQDERVLLLRSGFGARELFDAACRIAHVHPRFVLDAGDPQSLMALAEASRGIAVVPSTVAFTGRRVRVAPLLHARASLGVWGWIVWNPQRSLLPFARSFVDGLVRYTRRTYPGRVLDRLAPAVPRPREVPHGPR